MGSRYLVELAEWCRDVGLRVIEDNGWQTRARSSGGYDSGEPCCVMWHHTASNTNAQNDVDYICRGSSDAPVANLYLARNGDVWVCAAGASNTNGKGGPHTTSRHVVPLDKMNTHAVSIEAANDGVGEPWSEAMIDAYFVLSNMLTARLGIFVDDICHHSVWAAGRKIDPARASAVQGSWQPSSTNSSGSWSLDDTRVEAADRLGTLPPPDPYPSPKPPEGDDEMRLICASDQNGTWWYGNGIERRPYPSIEVFDHQVVLAASSALVLVNTSGEIVRNREGVRTVDAATIEALGKRIE